MSKLFQKTIEQTLLSADIEGKNVEAFKKELESNFLDHQDHLVASGMNPKKAEHEVVKKFGNPIIIGKMFRKYTLTTKSIKNARMLANAIGAISIATGLYYGLSATLNDIRYWAILAVLGGIGAVVASKTINHSKLWQYGTVAGFLFLAMGQILPIVGGIGLLTNLCFYGYPIYICTRSNEIFLGLGIHLVLLVLCLWVVHEILLQKRLGGSTFY
jgi:hypothetical protein